MPAQTQRRHLEFFGPDLARGPVLSGAPDTASVQIAAALAQLRAPLLRSDDEILAHADFIRELADRLFPDFASAIHLDVGPNVSNSVAATIRVPVAQLSLLDVWLADSNGGGVTGSTPNTVTWSTGGVVDEVIAKKHWRILTTDTGLAGVTVAHGAPKTWYLATARTGRVVYSTALQFA